MRLPLKDKEMSNENVKEKIRNLLNLAASSHSEHEANSAFEKAQALALINQIDLASIRLKNQTVNEQEYEFSNLKIIGTNFPQWKRYLINHLSVLNGCKNFTDRDDKDNKGFVVAGIKDNIEIVFYFYDSICSQIEIAAKANIKAGKFSGKTSANNFKFGAVETVIQRLKKIQNEVLEEAKSSANSMAALVLVKNESEKVSKWIESKIELVNSKPIHITNPEQYARNLGREAGKNISLNKGFTSAPSNKLLK